MRLAIVFGLVVTSVWGQSTDAALAVLGQRRGMASVAELRALSSGLSYDTRQYGEGQAGYSARMLRAARTLSYLNAMRNATSMDITLGLALTEAYLNVGAMQLGGSDSRFYDRNGAMLTYQNSLLLLNHLYGRYPSDASIAGQAAPLRTSIT